MSPLATTGGLRFGQFVLDPSRRALTSDGSVVPLSSRAYDILHLLVKHRGRVVTKDEIMTAVWRGHVVEESNLAVQISALRRALGECSGGGQFILTVQGRGYRFVALVEAPGKGHAEPAGERRDVGERPRARWRRALFACLAGACALLAAWLIRVGTATRTLTPTGPRLSIVVLPFRTLSDGAADYVADAIADDLTTDLSHIPGSLVIARTSADAYRGRAISVGEIGRALNVRYVLEGSVRAMQGTLRVNAQLIEAATGVHLWAEHYDGAVARQWETQNDIVRRIGRAVDDVLLHTEIARATLERPGDADALDLFFRARSIIDRGETLPRMTEAQMLLERAVAKQPDFVEALSTLGWLLARKMQTYDYSEAARDGTEADRTTAHALALAPGNPAAMAARGRFLAYRGQCGGASALFNTALAADPGNTLALSGLANCAWIGGEPEKTIEFEETLLRVDPQSPANDRRFQTLGLAALFAGRPAQAIVFLLRVDGADTGGGGMTDQVTPLETTRLFLIAAYALTGDMAQARLRYDAFRRAWQNRTVWREMTYFNPAHERLPAFARVSAALHEAGMAWFADEHAPSPVPPGAAPLEGSDFTQAPAGIVGVETIDTARFRQLRAGPAPPVVIDVGDGRAVPPGAILLADVDAKLWPASAGEVARTAARDGMVFMGTGSFGIGSYNAAVQFVALGYRKVYWYRGGEEAWAAAAMPAEDRRAE